jgi:hypothetical protein
LTDGKRTFTVVVPVEVEYWLIDGKWEETISCTEWQKIEFAIELQYPGWFHRCYPDRNGNRKVSKADCPACQRRLTKQKSLVN